MDGKSSSYKGTAGLHKRKAEDEISSDKEKVRKLVAPISKINNTAFIPNKTVPTTTATTNGVSATSKPEPASTAPKPGSLKARLAQAAAIHEAQKAKNPTGGVRHKDHREHKRKLEEEAKKAAREKVKLKTKVPAKPGQRPLSNNVKPGPAAKAPAPSPPIPTYKGTANLNRPQIARPIAHKSKPLPGTPLRRSGSGAPPRRQYYSDDEEEEEEEDDYDSLSDMEVGQDELDREEEEALQEAVLDDKKEIALLARQKAEKEAKLKAARELQKKRY